MEPNYVRANLRRHPWERDDHYAPAALRRCDDRRSRRRGARWAPSRCSAAARRGGSAMIAVLPALPLVGMLLGKPATCTGAYQLFGVSPKYQRTIYRCTGTPFRSLTVSHGLHSVPPGALCRSGPRPPGWQRPRRSGCCALHRMAIDVIDSYQLVPTSATVVCDGRRRGTLTLDLIP